jgi:hypothetical protein
MAKNIFKPKFIASVPMATKLTSRIMYNNKLGQTVYPKLFIKLEKIIMRVTRKFSTSWSSVHKYLLFDSQTSHLQYEQKIDAHCKKSWLSGSTLASGDAGPIQPGVRKSFRHHWRQFYYKHWTFSPDFNKCWTSSTELDCSKVTTPGNEPMSPGYIPMFYCFATLSPLIRKFPTPTFYVLNSSVFN